MTDVEDEYIQDRRAFLTGAGAAALLGGIIYGIKIAEIGLENNRKWYEDFLRTFKGNPLQDLPQPFKDSIERAKLDSSLEREVSSYIQYLTESNSNRVALKNSLSRTTQYNDYVKEASKVTGLEENLIEAIITTESSGKLRVLSKAKAAGPMQLMPQTAEELGLRLDRFVDERYDPEKSIHAASEYLRKQLDIYNGNIVLALISYNWGPTNTRDFLRKYGANWDDLKDHLPDETKDYVVKILSIKKILDNIAKYGIEIVQQTLFSERLRNSFTHSVGEAKHYPK